MRAGVLTVSDKGSRGEREDTAGAFLKEALLRYGFKEVLYRIVADDYDQILSVLIDWSDREGLELILTTGGTGLSPRDVTPEATRAALHREVPGISEALRAYGLKFTPYSMLSRGVSGIRGNTLIVNLPGSRKAVEEGWQVIEPVLRHAIEKIKGSEEECGRG